MGRAGELLRMDLAGRAVMEVTYLDWKNVHHSGVRRARLQYGHSVYL
jgi:hypothetical protein